MATIVLWIDADLENEENKEYIKELKLIGSIRLNLFENIETAIEQLKNIEFKETKIIISESLFPEFIESFNENISDMYVAPKIIIFTEDKENFIKLNQDNNNDKYYTYSEIATSFNDIKEFLINKENKEIKKQEDVQLTFEYIDKKENLILPLFFKTLIENIPNDDIKNYTNMLYETYSKENKELKELFGSITSINNIPIEILSRYYSRFYTADSEFYRNINKDLGLNQNEKYLPFIKILYEGIKEKSLPLSNNNILYRGEKIPNEDINKIKDYLNKKIEGLPCSIVFSKSFLSFSKDKDIAEQFLKEENNNENISKVLFILEKDKNMGYNLSTHGDIEKISFYPDEREVLFFPFSSFEINGVKEVNLENEKIYEINLSYLSKYLKDIKKDNNLSKIDILIPDTEFKKQIEEFGLIKKEENQTIKVIYNKYKKYEKGIKNIDKIINNIIGEINIGPNDINKDIQIINSYENYKKINKLDSNKNDHKYENEKEIKENIEIKINGKKIKFSYTHKFEKEGKCKIEFLFKKNLTKINHMFYGCSSLININFSNFNTQNVTDMSCMFTGCSSLSNLNLSNFKTQNTIDMNHMFSFCYLLTDLNVSNFNTEKVTDTSYMFSGCNSLINLNVSNFNTENVTNMSFMFFGCNSLANLNLSNFNTQNVKNMSNMFDGCNSLITLDLSNFKTQNVCNMSYLFQYCKSLTNLNLTNFNTQNVTDMSGMFQYCNSLISLNLSNFNTQNVTDMRYMFNGCNSLTDLNLSNFNTQKETDLDMIFNGCNSLIKNKIILKDAKILNLINYKINSKLFYL